MAGPNRIKFGANGWRGIVGEAFTDGNLRRVATAFSDYLVATGGSGGSVAIGYDGRLNSRSSAESFARIIADSGVRVLFSDGIVPTPVLSFAVKHFGCRAGVMVTASHNPDNYNGVKFKGPYGGPFLPADTAAVASFLPSTGREVPTESRYETVSFLPPYRSHLERIIDVEALRRYARNPDSRSSVMIDSMGGAGQTIIEDFLADCGWRAQTIFGTPEPTFYHRIPEPIDRNLGPLKYNTAVTDAQFGIATDGDGDRCSIVFEDGRWMTAQENILALLWHLHTQKEMRGAVIKSASVTDIVRLLAERWQEKVFDVDVGFSNVTDVMLRRPFLFGAEESGGFGFQHHIPERDGILSGLLFCEMVAMSGKRMSDLWDDIRASVGDVHYDRIDLRVDRGDRNELIQRCKAYKPSKRLEEYYIQVVRTYRDAEILNGIKFCFGDSQWLLIRMSQTEPLIRIYAEGKSNTEVEKFLEEGKELVSADCAPE